MDKTVEKLAFLYRHSDILINNITEIKIETIRIIFNYMGIDVIVISMFRSTQ
jgi:hypothetical protein